jgi:iron complex outermembrane recepter protein
MNLQLSILGKRQQELFGEWSIVAKNHIGRAGHRLQQIGLLSSVAALGLLAISETPVVTSAFAQTTSGQEPQNLPQVTVARPKARPKRVAAQPKTQAAPRALPQPTPVVTASTPSNVATPLNTNVVAESASRLGLTPRQTPASVEVVGAQQIQEQGYQSMLDVVRGATGVLAGDAPNDTGFSVRGFSNNQVSVLYNGINPGPTGFTALVMGTANLASVEFYKGPDSLMAGQGAIGGAINYVTKAPHTGPVVNEAFVGYDSFGGWRTGFGSGGSTSIKGLDYRFDVSRAYDRGFIDDTNVKNLHLSTQWNYRVSETFKTFLAVEYKDYSSRDYQGTPLVPVGPGIVPTSGIVSGYKVPTSIYGDPPLHDIVGPVTIDARTLKTNYNVLDGHKNANELWVRSGFEWNIASNVKLNSVFFAYDAHRDWFNNEVTAFDTAPPPTASGPIYRERFFVHHDQQMYGNNSRLTWDSNISGMDNRFVVGLDISRVDFNRPGAANFPNDYVNLVNFDRGFYGPLQTKRQTAVFDTVAVNLEDRIKITPTFSVVGGLRFEHIDLDRTSTDKFGVTNTGFPFSKSFDPASGRIGYTWEALPGTTFYSQYARAQDFSAGSGIFLLDPKQPLMLSPARTYETGVKQLLWGGRAEWMLSAYDIERKNVFTAQGGQKLALAGTVKSQGVEFSAAARPTPELKLWGNIAFIHSRYTEFVLDTTPPQSLAGNTPPNVPAVVVNGGASYRILNPGWLPVEVGVSVRHVGDRFNSDENTVKMLAYTTADAFAFVDIPKAYLFPTMESARLTFRVRNFTDTKYAAWGDPFYPAQIILGAPRSFEVMASTKF